ncbi:MAG: winged helix-turn-helix domain-containing protein [Patescibacteria group bacterium]|nr:winged helix-turn-helix domain-containing protein [Patescibacteria group bacterium]
MDQSDLFSFIPIAANQDPETSHESARRVNASGSRKAHARMVLELVRLHPGSTSCELHAAQYVLDRHEVSRRLSDLLHAGLVRQETARPCRIKGTRMVTWRIVETIPGQTR